MYIISNLVAGMSLAWTLNSGTDSKTEQPKILKPDALTTASAVLLPFKWMWEWRVCVQNMEWERCRVSLYVWVSELCLWAEPLQTTDFIVYISSCSWVCSRKLCCATHSLPPGHWYEDSGPALLPSSAPACGIQPGTLTVQLTSEGVFRR